MLLKAGYYYYNLQSIQQVYISSDDILLYFPLSPNDDNEFSDLLITVDNLEGSTLVCIRENHTLYNKLYAWVHKNCMFELT